MQVAEEHVEIGRRIDASGPGVDALLVVLGAVGGQRAQGKAHAAVRPQSVVALVLVHPQLCLGGRPDPQQAL